MKEVKTSSSQMYRSNGDDSSTKILIENSLVTKLKCANAAKKNKARQETDILANRRRHSTITDDVVLIFLNSMMGTIVESWERKIIKKPKRKSQQSVEFVDNISHTSSLHSEKEHTEPKLQPNYDPTSNKNSHSFKQFKESQEDEKSSHNINSKGRVTKKESENNTDYSKTEIRGTESSKDVADRLSINKSSEKRKGSSSEKHGVNEKHNLDTCDEGLKEEISNISLDKAENIDNSQKEKTEKATRKKEEETEESTDWRVSFPDEEVSVVFTNGNTYEGHISRKLMEGHGCFTWTDGSVYEGEFQDGKITGFGLMKWKDESWYEGEFYCGYRHGKGTFVAPEGHFTYNGNWYLGKKHGEGTFYDGVKGDNYYSGDFEDEKRHGFGCRQYPSGARYEGEWKNDLRHGNGTMIWSNDDIYHGNWEDNVMNGYGEYTWNAFTNNQFTYPAQNMYKGSWEKGVRHGKGMLQISCGKTFFGEWINGLRHGAGMIICSDGTVKMGSPLFIKDHLVECSDSVDDLITPKQIEECKEMEQKKIKKCSTRTQSTPKSVVKTNKLTTLAQSLIKSDSKLKKKESVKFKHLKGMTELRIFHESKGRPQKIFLHGTNFDLSFQLSCLLRYITEVNQFYRSKIKFDEPHKQIYVSIKDLIDVKLKESKCYEELDSTSEIYCESLLSEEELRKLEFENKWLHRAIDMHMHDLVGVYNKYAAVACTTEPECEVFLARMMFWQLERDCGFHKKISLAEVDELLDENPDSYVHSKHDPFEPIHFWQFLHYLLEISWLLYVVNNIGYENAPGILCSAFIKLMREDILPNVGKHTGAVLFKYRDIAPMDAVYMLYKNIGEPHTAREFLKQIFEAEPIPSPLTQEEIYHCYYSPNAFNGTNTFYVRGNTMYLPATKPASKVVKDTENQDQTFSFLNCLYEDNLSSFSNLTPKQVVDHLTEICPTIKSEGLICNMNYKLVFIEFYEVLLLCAEHSIRKEVTRTVAPTVTNPPKKDSYKTTVNIPTPPSRKKKKKSK